MPTASHVVYDATPSEERRRLTVFFRVILVLPHLVTLLVYGIGLIFAVIAAWVALLVTGRYPAGLYGFVSGVARYYARLSAYSYLLVDPYPPFDLGEHPEYPVRLHVAPPLESYNRMKVLFRIVLLIPVYVINYVLGLVSQLIAVLIWLLAVILGRTPPALLGIETFCLSYVARATAYACLLSEDWPAIDQGDAVPPPAAPAGFAAPGSPPPPPPASPDPFGR